MYYTYYNKPSCSSITYRKKIIEIPNATSINAARKEAIIMCYRGILDPHEIMLYRGGWGQGTLSKKNGIWYWSRAKTHNRYVVNPDTGRISAQD